jgi:hypothetical protein
VFVFAASYAFGLGVDHFNESGRTDHSNRNITPAARRDLVRAASSAGSL